MTISKFHFITQEKDNLSHLETVEKACKIGINWIQLRIKNKSLEQIRLISLEAKKICDRYNSKLIINDYWEIAKEIGANGVHVGMNDEKIDFIRRKLGEKFIIGGTANTLEDVILQSKRGANYIGLGPLRNTQTKKIDKPLIGFSGYKNILKYLNEMKIKTPIIAIGGIKLDDIKKLKDIGIYGIAASSLIIDCNFYENQIHIIKETLSF